MSDTDTLLKEEIRDPATARKYFAAAEKSEQQGEKIRALEAYEAAYAADPDDAEVCFRLAYTLDLVGEEDEALHLYEQAAHLPQPRLNALLNLAVMYEDRGQYSQSERCLRQVLTTEPNHPRARLYIKDVLASKAMMVDDEAEARAVKTDAVLDTPVTDFELSVRTRNALRKMNIRTLADLLRVTESELRAYKNFGDASIEEIKGMLAQKGLKMGAALELQQSAAKKAVYDQLKEETGSSDEVLNKSVNELQLSVRARKALAILNVQTIGDLAAKTEAELMGVKNFGMTSLLEIKEKLGGLGLGLRTLEEEAAP
ncbi:MAG: DNA-directed RNA polymerase subunit alpha C-terminal domain-containing protein [Phycisphaeraceae bacterium]